MKIRTVRPALPPPPPFEPLETAVAVAVGDGDTVGEGVGVGVIALTVIVLFLATLDWLLTKTTNEYVPAAVLAGIVRVVEKCPVGSVSAVLYTMTSLCPLDATWTVTCC